MRKTSIVLVVFLLGFTALVVTATRVDRAIFSRAFAETPAAGGSTWPTEIVLPAGRKLVNVTWLCHAACEPWTVTRPGKAGETPESYSFTNGRDSITVRETPVSR
jgi:hypothetical protein